MKTITSGVTASIDKKDLEELLKETKETLATGKRSTHTFGVVDLWRMQKKHKTLGSSTRW